MTPSNTLAEAAPLSAPRAAFDRWRSISSADLGGLSLGAGLGYDSVFVMCASAAFAGLLIYGAMYLGTILALAESS